VETKTDEIKSGAGGTYYFTIEAEELSRNGIFEITYDRSWDNEPALRSFIIPIKVTANSPYLVMVADP